MRYIQTHVTPLITTYFEILKEAFSDINAFLDSSLESENVQNFVIALAISAPFVGAFFFVAMIQLSA